VFFHDHNENVEFRVECFALKKTSHFGSFLPASVPKLHNLFRNEVLFCSQSSGWILKIEWKNETGTQNLLLQCKTRKRTKPFLTCVWPWFLFFFWKSLYARLSEQNSKCDFFKKKRPFAILHLFLTSVLKKKNWTRLKLYYLFLKRFFLEILFTGSASPMNAGNCSFVFQLSFRRIQR